jgi:tRNA 2-thiouridine synthesizing protein E
MHPYEHDSLQTTSQQLLKLDSDGFLLFPDTWNHTIAKQLARLELIGELNEQQWQAIKFVRDHYYRLGAPPSMRRVCRSLTLSPYKSHALFNSCLQLWRIAGLPNPGDEARAHLT